MKKRMLRSLALALCLGLLAGCGGKSEEPMALAPTATPAPVVATPTPAPTPEPTPEPAPADSYATMVSAIRSAHSDALFELLAIDEDEAPELVCSWNEDGHGYVTLYTLVDGEAVSARDSWPIADQSALYYAPGKNVIMETGSGQGGAAWEDTFYRVGADHKVEKVCTAGIDPLSGVPTVNGQEVTQEEYEAVCVPCDLPVIGVQSAQTVLTRLAGVGQGQSLAALTQLKMIQLPGGPGVVSDGAIAFRDTTKPKYNQVGFLDVNGTVLVPAQYSGAGDFQSGYAIVSTRKDRDYIYCGIIDKSGKEIITPNKDAINYLGTWDGKVCHEVCDELTENAHGLCVNGKMVTKSKYRSIELIEDAPGCFLTSIIVKEGERRHVGRYGVIDINGKEIIETKFKERPAVWDPGEGWDPLFVAYGDKGCTVYSAKGSRADSLTGLWGGFMEGYPLVCVVDGNKYALATPEKRVTEAIYDGISFFETGRVFAVGNYANQNCLLCQNGVVPGAELGKYENFRSVEGRDDVVQAEKADGTVDYFNVAGLTQPPTSGTEQAPQVEAEPQPGTEAEQVPQVETESEPEPETETVPQQTAQDKGYWIGEENGKPILCCGVKGDMENSRVVIQYYKDSLYYDVIAYLGEGYYGCCFNTTWYLVHP